MFSGIYKVREICFSNLINFNKTAHYQQIRFSHKYSNSCGYKNMRLDRMPKEGSISSLKIK